MAVSLQQQIAALYSGIFNRAPDKQGLEFWVLQMQQGASLSVVAEGFTNHPVFTETYGGMSNLDMVRALYVNMLGSAGDENGIQFWAAKLDGGTSFGEVVSDFVSGALAIDLEALLDAGDLTQADYDAAVVRQNTITNKVEAGLYFVERFGEASNLGSSTDGSTKAGLESDPVYLASQAAIANVTADAVSVAAAKAAIDSSPAPLDLLLVISGEATQGETLTASSLLGAEPDDISYQWLRDGVAVDGATDASYVLTQADVDAKVSVSVRYTDTYGAQQSVSSKSTIAVKNVDDAATGELTVSGTAEQGAVLTADMANVVDADGETTTAYQWQVQAGEEWSDIEGATAAEFAIADDQSLIGQNVRVVATTTDALGGTSVFTGEAQTVANINNAPVVQNALASQSATQGQAFSFTVPADTFIDIDGDALTYSVALVDDNGGLVGDGSLPSWMSFDAAAGKFTGTPADGDVGVINVQVTATDLSGATASSTFNLTQIDATAPVTPTLTLDAADDTGLVGDLVTNKTAVTLNVGGIEANGRAWLDKDGNSSYDAGVDQLAVDGKLSVSGLVIGGNSYKVISSDASGNTSSRTVNVVRDTAAPNRDVETPISVTSEKDGAYSEGDSITVMFGEVVNIETLRSGTTTVANGHTLGEGATFVAVDADANGYANTFTLTIGANPSLVAGDTVSFASGDVVDIAGNKAIGAVAFTLPVIDDEIAPVFTSEATAAADEIQNVLYIAVATDATGVTYSLKAGNIDDATLLAIDAETGAVTLASGVIDHEDQSSYSFTVVATDGSGNISEQAVTVTVNDLDEIAPAITSGGVAEVIVENSGAGQVVYTATATDDGDVSGGFTFSLKADNADNAASFTIDEQTGEVTLVDDPDFETLANYSFTVVATDAAGNSSEQAVSLAISDLDDTAPEKPAIALGSDTGVDETAGSEISSDVAIELSNHEPNATIEYSLDGETWLDAQGYADATVSDGEYSVVVRQTDEAGNVSEVSDALTFIKDSTAATAAAEMAVTTATGAYVQGKTITLNFSEPVRASDVTIGNLVVSGAASLGAGATLAAVGAGEYASSFTLTLGTDATVVQGTTLTLAAGAQDIAGNAGAEIVFTLPDATAPMLSTVSVIDGGTSTSLDGSIDLTFDEFISLERSDFSGVTLMSGGLPVQVTVSIDETDARIVHITPVDPLILAQDYTLSWGEGAFADAAGNAVSASAGDGVQFSASGDYTGTVAQVNALAPTQLDAATSITVQDSAEALSAADFSTGNLSYARADLERTITINGADLAEQRFIVVQVGNLEPVEMWMGGTTTAAELAIAVANTLKARDTSGAFDDTTVVVANDGANASITFDASLNLGTASIDVAYAQPVFDTARYPIEASAFANAEEAVVRITELDALESADRFVQVLGLHPTSSTFSFTEYVYPGMTAWDVAQGIVAEIHAFDGDSGSYDPDTGDGDRFRPDTVSLRTTAEGIEIVLTGDALAELPYFDQVKVQYGQYNPGALIDDTASAVTPASPPAITQIALAAGEAENAYLQVADLAGRVFELDNSGENVTGQFVLQDSAAALAAVTAELSQVQGLDSYEVRDTLGGLFSGDLLSAALTDVLGRYVIDKLTVTEGALNLAQAQALAAATAGEAADGEATALIYDLTDSAASLLAATEEQLVLINGAGDADVSDINVGAVTYEQLQALYSLTDVEGAHDQGAFTYSLTAASGQLFEGDALKTDAVTGDYLHNASALTVNGALSLAQAEALTSFVTADVEDDLSSVIYDLALTTAELLAAYGTEANHPQRELLNGARDITVTDSMTVEQAGYLANISNTGFNSYSIVDTAANLAGGNAQIVQGALNLEATTIATASQAAAIYANQGADGTLTYDVTDNISNLAGANAAAMGAAGNVISTGYWTSVAQAQTIVGFENTGYTELQSVIQDSVAALDTFIDTNGAGEEEGLVLRPYTYNVRDTAAHIAAAAADAIDPLNLAKDETSETTQHVLLNADQIVVTNSATYTQASSFVNDLNVAKPSLLTDDKVSFSVNDTVANLTNDRIWLNGDIELNDTNRATSFVDGLYVSDSAANIAAAQNGNGVIDSADREVFQRMDQVGYGGITASGSDGGQTIAGSKWSDDLNGGEGNDTLFGNAGSDTLYGGNGNDTLYGGDGRDTIYAGTGAGEGTGTNYSGISNWIYGGNGGDNLFGSGTTGFYDRDQFVYVGNTKEALVAESGTFTTTRDYISNMGYGDSIEFSSVDNSNIFFQGTSNNVANAVEAGTLALAISYDRNVQVANWNDSGLVTATKVNIDIASAAGNFDGVADMSIIIVGSDMDLNWDGTALVSGA